MVPVMERERIAALVGVESGVVSGCIERGHVPTVKIGRYRLINLVALTRKARRRRACRDPQGCHALRP